MAEDLFKSGQDFGKRLRINAATKSLNRLDENLNRQRVNPYSNEAFEKRSPLLMQIDPSGKLQKSYQEAKDKYEQEEESARRWSIDQGFKTRKELRDIDETQYQRRKDVLDEEKQRLESLQNISKWAAGHSLKLEEHRQKQQDAERKREKETKTKADTLATYFGGQVGDALSGKVDADWAGFAVDNIKSLILTSPESGAQARTLSEMRLRNLGDILNQIDPEQDYKEELLKLFNNVQSDPNSAVNFDQDVFNQDMLNNVAIKLEDVATKQAVMDFQIRYSELLASGKHNPKQIENILRTDGGVNIKRSMEKLLNPFEERTITLSDGKKVQGNFRIGKRSIYKDPEENYRPVFVENVYDINTGEHRLLHVRGKDNKKIFADKLPSEGKFEIFSTEES